MERSAAGSGALTLEIRTWFGSAVSTLKLTSIPLPPDSRRKYDAVPPHRLCPCLLRGLAVEPVNRVVTDASDIPMRRGFLSLAAIMDRASRRVLAWRVSNSLDPMPIGRTRLRVGSGRRRLMRGRRSHADRLR